MHVLICIDGLDPRYLEPVSLPNLEAVGRSGTHMTVHSALPSVTNVNNVSLITGASPLRHGITGNYWRNGAGQFDFMEDSQCLLHPTVFERHPQWRTLALIAKHKLVPMVGRGATHVISAEAPPSALVDAIGAPPPIYSAGVSVWLLRALRHLLEHDLYDFIYVSTTDYVMHRAAPDDPEAQDYLRALDEEIGRLLDPHPDLKLWLTADHGMNQKCYGIDVTRVLADVGIRTRFVPVIKDRYVVHHNNLGGFAYLYLPQQQDIDEARSRLENLAGVEEVYGRDDAPHLGLHLERVGDLIILAGQDVVFGDFERPATQLSLRSHGSRHETRVPLISTLRTSRELQFQYEVLSWIESTVA